MSWQDVTETDDLLEDDEVSDIDNDDAAFIKEFDGSWDPELSAEVQTASIKTVVDGIHRIAKVCNAQIVFPGVFVDQKRVTYPESLLTSFSASGQALNVSNNFSKLVITTNAVSYVSSTTVQLVGTRCMT